TPCLATSFFRRAEAEHWGDATLIMDIGVQRPERFGINGSRGEDNKTTDGPRDVLQQLGANDAFRPWLNVRDAYLRDTCTDRSAFRSQRGAIDQRGGRVEPGRAELPNRGFADDRPP